MGGTKSEPENQGAAEPAKPQEGQSESRYRNDDRSYKALTDLVTRARLEGKIPFHAIHDPTRPVSLWRVYHCPSPFFRDELGGFLKGYYRDLMQSQPNHIEVLAEKNSLNSILEPVYMEYRIPMTTGRGYCCLDARHNMVKRFRKSGKERLVLLILSDFDPDGENIAESFARSLRDDLGVYKIEPVKVALTHDQVTSLKLPPSLKAKKPSTSYQKFADKFGDDAFELEALPPEQLQDILRDAIDSVIDVDLFNAEIDAEKNDAAELDVIRRKVQAGLKESGALEDISEEEGKDDAK